MTSQEFSDQFDLLWNNIASNQAPGLDSYEKSVFLTKAQNEILLSYFNPILNKSQNGFDGSEKRQIDFSNIIVTGSVQAGDAIYKNYNHDSIFGNRAGSYVIAELTNLSEDVKILMMINETMQVTRNNKTIYLTVVPITYTDIQRMYSKPYKRPLKDQAWRIFTNGETDFAKILIGAEDTPEYYYYRFIKKPYPIILENLTEDNVSIDGYILPYEEYNSDQSEGCMLDTILHEEILQRAVELAKGAWTGDLQSSLVLGTASETNMGFLTSSK